MVNNPAGIVFTPDNWQGLVMETAEFPRPAGPETLSDLSQKLVNEALELVMANPDETEAVLGRAVLFLTDEQIELAPFPVKTHSLESLQAEAAGECGDILWYEVSLLSELDISMDEVLAELWAQLNQHGVAAKINDFPDIARQAAEYAPPTSPAVSELMENPFVVYVGHFVSDFCRNVDPKYNHGYLDRPGAIRSAAALLWATTYLLKQACNADLQTVLNRNYSKLHQRAEQGIPQGINIEDRRWIPRQE